jgi:branched-chain amino acid transport system substrate-binding protein
VMKAAKAADPDAFVAWSYPPDTFGLADAAKILISRMIGSTLAA